MAISVIFSSPIIAQSMSGYHLSKSIHIDGNGSWDYLIADSKTRQLYVTHSDTISVINMDSGKVVGEIGGLSRAHGVAVVDALGLGYISNGGSDKITIFDLKNLEIKASLPAGKNPDAIIYDPFSKRVFAFNHSGGDVTVIDPAENKIVGTINVGGELEYGVSDENGAIFVNVEDRNEIVKIDSINLNVLSRWSIAPCEAPTGIALDRETHRLFSSCSDNAMLAVVNADDGHLVTEVKIGEGSDGTRFDPATKQIITSNGEGSLSIIQEDNADSYHVVQTVKTLPGARTLEVDLDTHRIYTATSQFSPALKNSNSRPERLEGTFRVMEFTP